MLCSTTQLRFTCACRHWSRYRKITERSRREKKPHQCPNMTTNRGHQHILHQLTTCTGVQVLHWHLSHIRKNSVSNWNYCWAIYSLACRIPEEFGRDLWRTLLLCNKFVLSKEKERMALVLRTELLTDEVQDQVHLPYVDCTFLWLLEGCSQDQRWKGGAVPLRSRSIPTACTVCDDQVWNSVSSWQWDVYVSS
jgi:hypothetical protein